MNIIRKSFGGIMILTTNNKSSFTKAALALIACSCMSTAMADQYGYVPIISEIDGVDFGTSNHSQPCSKEVHHSPTINKSTHGRFDMTTTAGGGCSSSDSYVTFYIFDKANPDEIVFKITYESTDFGSPRWHYYSVTAGSENGPKKYWLYVNGTCNDDSNSRNGNFQVWPHEGSAGTAGHPLDLTWYVMDPMYAQKPAEGPWGGITIDNPGDFLTQARDNTTGGDFCADGFNIGPTETTDYIRFEANEVYTGTSSSTSLAITIKKVTASCQVEDYAC